MARQPRLDLPGVPQHVVQRGNNRSACFFDDRHRRLYLDFLAEAAAAADVHVHAYVLMTNHVHLLITSPVAGAMSAMMQNLGRRYVQRFNALRGRTGTLFEGRFKSNLVQSDRHLLSCYRYIELNPVRAGLSADPARYPWSSYRCNALGQGNRLIRVHPTFAELGRTPQERRARYRELVAAGVADDEAEAIRLHLKQGRVLGSRAFIDWIEASTGRRAGASGRGRPRKKNGSDPI